MQARAPVTPLGATVPRTLATLQRLRGLSDGRLAAAAGWTSRQQVEQRRRGHTAITVDDLHRLSVALDVPPSILLMPPAEAVQWVAVHRPESITGAVAPMSDLTPDTRWYRLFPSQRHPLPPRGNRHRSVPPQMRLGASR